MDGPVPTRPKLLWNGDACVPTGFARVTHHLLDVLRHTWDVAVLGINYFGDPHGYPYPIYPAALGGDTWGIYRVPALYRHLRPDLFVIQNDPWNVSEYLRALRKERVPIVAFMPVDGRNCRGKALNGLALAVFYTEFGRREASAGGYEGPSAVMGLGVDTRLYRPMPRAEARERMGLAGRVPEDAFILGNVNRNQPRKRLDLTIAYVAAWLERRRAQGRPADNVYLYLHVAPTGDLGWDVMQLARYFGIDRQLIVTSKQQRPEAGVREEDLALVYSAFDLQITTTQGEGFGLPTLEGMACGVPQVAPDWAALGEWPEDAIWKVPCSAIAATPQDINAIGGVVDRDPFLDALDAFYDQPEVRAEYSRRALEQARRPRFDWQIIGVEFDDMLRRVLAQKGESHVETDTVGPAAPAIGPGRASAGDAGNHEAGGIG